MGDKKKTARLSFRTSEMLRGKVDELCDKSGHALADVCNFALLAFWADIEALVLANSGPLPTDDRSVERRRALLARFLKLEEMGVNIDDVMFEALERAGLPKLMPTGTEG